MLRSLSEDILENILLCGKANPGKKSHHIDAYMAFIDLAKAFDTINRDLLWIQLAKQGLLGIWMEHPKWFHTGTNARVVMGALKSDPFSVEVGVQQGCAHAPVAYNMFRATVTRLFNRNLSVSDGVKLQFWLHGNLFNLRRL